MVDAAVLSAAFFTIVFVALTLHIRFKKPLPDDDLTTEAAAKIQEKGNQYGFHLTTKQAIELVEIILKALGDDAK